MLCTLGVRDRVCAAERACGLTDDVEETATCAQHACYVNTHTHIFSCRASRRHSTHVERTDAQTGAAGGNRPSVEGNKRRDAGVRAHYSKREPHACFLVADLTVTFLASVRVLERITCPRHGRDAPS